MSMDLLKVWEECDEPGWLEPDFLPYPAVTEPEVDFHHWDDVEGEGWLESASD